MPRLIDSYLAEFDRELGFDRGLARRVHQEVEAHLLDAMDDAATEDEAIRRFGSPKILARAYADAALPSRLRTTWIVAIGMAITTFSFMRIRSVFLTIPDAGVLHMEMLTAIDRAGFIAGLLFSLYAWRVSRYGRQRILPPLTGAAAAFVLSVIASLFRAVSITGGDPLIWITGALEILMIFVVMRQLHSLHRHFAAVSVSKRGGA